MTRRDFLATATTGALRLSAGQASGGEPHAGQALIAVTLDLEMCRNFPRWEDTHWDYEKGNLTDEAKRYAVEACRRVKAAGGVAHCFAVGRVFEQADVDWLKQIAKAPVPSYPADIPGVTLLDETIVTVAPDGGIATLHRRAIRILGTEGRDLGASQRTNRGHRGRRASGHRVGGRGRKPRTGQWSELLRRRTA